MSTKICGFQFGPMTQDEEGQRDYTFYYYVESDDGLDGPAQVLQTDGLPQDGSTWQAPEGFRDQDEWAWCRGNRKIAPDQSDDEKVKRWKLEFLFSTKPQRPDKQRCLDNPITDPLLEPPKITGSFVKEKEAAAFDRFGNPINNSAFEPIRGPQVEFDADKPTITIEQNVGSQLQGYVLPSLFANCVNQFPLWGLPPRTIKLVPDTWSREYYGTCLVYYKRKLTFEINTKTWDRSVLDEGTKVLAGDWVVLTPGAKPVWRLRATVQHDPLASFDPSNFIRYVDPSGNPSRVVLNGRGLPSGVEQITTGTSAGFQAALAELLALLNSTGSLSTRLVQSLGIPNPNGQQTVWLQVAADMQAILNAVERVLRFATFQTRLVSAVQVYQDALLAFIMPVNNANLQLTILPADEMPASFNNAVFAAATPYGTAAVALSQALTGTGSGTSAEDTGDAGRVFISKYDEVDFLLLGIPTEF